MPGITLRNIAERVGCSRSTVSYALRNNPGCSAATRQRVLEVARELGWRPDADLALQMTAIRRVTTHKRTPTLAVVMNPGLESLTKNSAPALQLDGIRTQAGELGFNLDEFSLTETPLSPKRLRGILQARGIQGIVFLGTIEPALPTEFLEMGVHFTCAVSGVRYPSMPFHVTVPDFLAAGRSAILEILDLGFVRPAVMISRNVDEPLNWGFSGGAYTGLLSVSEEDRLPLQFFDQDEPHARLVEWIIENEPDCLLSLNVQRTGEVVDRLDGRCAEPVQFAFDWYPDQKVAGGIDLMQRDVGRAAVDLVVDQLSRGQTGLPTVQRCLNIEGIWATKEEYLESHFFDGIEGPTRRGQDVVC